MKYSSFFSRAGWVLFLLVVLAFPAIAFEVSYDYYVFAADSDGIPIMGDAILDGQTYVDGDYTKLGGYENYGSAVFYANLVTATVSSWAYAHGTQTGPNSTNVHNGTGRVQKIGFRDKLTYTVAAGYYPDGVQVSIGGRANGIIESDVGAGARASCRVSLYTEVFDTGLLEVGTDEAGTIHVDEDFMLTVQLVLPETTLGSPRNYDMSLAVSIGGGQTWSVAYNTGSGYVTGDGSFDFTDGLKITQFKVPPGVTWTSESGVFPNLPSSVRDETLPMHAPRLLQNHPNPFNPQTTISFNLPKETTAHLRVYDLSGRLVRTLLNDEMVQQGRNEVVWNGRDDFGRQVVSGIYFYRLEAAGYTETKRMTLVK